jgi:hypothetical protein
LADHSLEADEIVRYLLGDLPEEERQRVERAYFENEGSYRRLLEIEDDLAGCWARGELSGKQREYFVKRLLASETGRSKAQFAQALAKVAGRLTVGTASQSARPTRGILVWMPAAAALTLAVLGGIEVRRLQMRVTALDAQLEAGRARAVRMPDQPLPSFLLLPGLTRGPEALRQLALPAGAVSVRFQLQFPAGRPDGPLAARLVLADGHEVWSGMAAAGGDRTAEVVVPAAVLVPEEYDLTIERLGETGNGVTFHFAMGRR